MPFDQAGENAGSPTPLKLLALPGWAPSAALPTKSLSKWHLIDLSGVRAVTLPALKPTTSPAGLGADGEWARSPKHCLIQSNCRNFPSFFFPPSSLSPCFYLAAFEQLFSYHIKLTSLTKKQMSNSPGFLHNMLQGSKSLLNHTLYLPEHRFYSLTKYLSHPQKISNEKKKKISDNILLKLHHPPKNQQASLPANSTTGAVLGKSIKLRLFTTVKDLVWRWVMWITCCLNFN